MERSYWWQTNGIGDGKAEGYGASNLFEIWRMLWTSDTPNLSAVTKGYLDSLDISSPGADQVRMDRGGAIVYGCPYVNDTQVIKRLVRPGADTGWQAVLRLTWEDQTVRFALLQSVAGDPAIPPRTTTPGVVWEIPLAYGIIDNVGAISVNDDRHYLLSGIELQPSNMGLQSRQMWVPCVGNSLGDAAVEAGFPLIDGVTTNSWGSFMLPDFYEPGGVLTAQPMWSGAAGGGGGDVVIVSTAYIGQAVGGALDDHTVTHIDTELGPAGPWTWVITPLLTLYPVATTQDIILLELERIGANAADTYTATMWIKGWWVQYTAQM